MSTFLVTLTVVVLSVVGAVAIAVQDPAQPATTRPRRRREPGAAGARRPLPPVRRPASRPVSTRPSRKPVQGQRAAPASPANGTAAPTQTLKARPLETVRGGRAVRSVAPVARGARVTPTASVPRPASAATGVDLTGLTDQWGVGPLGQSIWVRIRSGAVLTMLLAVMGTLIAACTAGFVVAIALAVRAAVK